VSAYLSGGSVQEILTCFIILFKELLLAFSHERTLFLKQEFWGLSFEDCKTYGLDIPRRLHMRGNKASKVYHDLRD